MELSKFFKAVIDSDIAPVVVCNLDNMIVYMNPEAARRYEKRGGAGLIGKNLLNCHNQDSRRKIIMVVDWFMESTENNRIFTFHNPKENKDVYMIALRDDDGTLIGYYEKHEFRTLEKDAPYQT